MTPAALVWFKRDLRLRDHAPLAQAVHFGQALGLVVIEPEWLASPDCDPRHVAFLLDCVAGLQRDLAARGLPLVVRTGSMPQVLQSLRHEFAFTHLFSSEETGPGWSYTRDIAVADWCRHQNVRWTELPQTGVVRRLRSRDGWRRGDRGPDVSLSMRTGVTVAALLIPLQIVVGDLHGLNTLQHQPAKIAAIEAIWQTQKGAPMVLFGLPDAEARETRYAIEVPRLASLVLTHDLDGEVKGLDAFAGQHPPVAPVFFSFRLMVGIGMLMLLVSWVGWWQLRPNSRRAEPSPLLTGALLA